MSQPNAILFAELPKFAADVTRGHRLHRMVVYPLVNIWPNIQGLREETVLLASEPVRLAWERENVAELGMNWEGPCKRLKGLA